MDPSLILLIIYTVMIGTILTVSNNGHVRVHLYNIHVPLRVNRPLVRLNRFVEKYLNGWANKLDIIVESLRRRRNKVKLLVPLPRNREVSTVE